MDEFLTDDQQADRARQWIRENGIFIAAGVLLGLGGLFGWQQWNTSQIDQAGQASIVWEQLRSAVAGERYNEVSETLAQLEKEHSSTPYLDQARLTVARMHLDRNETDLAAEQLVSIVKGTKDLNIKRVAQLRLAQVQIAQEKYADALTTLGASDTSSFAGQYHEMRGDIFYFQGDLEAARNEYQAALDAPVAGVIDRSYVQIKLDDVTGTLSDLPAQNVAAAPAAETPE